MYEHYAILLFKLLASCHNEEKFMFSLEFLLYEL